MFDWGKKTFYFEHAACVFMLVNYGVTRRVARIWKRGGFFEKVRKVQTTLTRIFIVLESESHGLSENWDGISRKAWKFKRFFSPKTGGLKKKKVFTKIETDVSAKIGNLNVFSAQKQVVSKKKVFTVIETNFSAKFGNSNVFSGRITTCTSQLRHPISFRGGCFQFFTKNRPQKHQNRAILHTSQANGGGSSYPPPPGYATGCNYSTSAINQLKVACNDVHSVLHGIPRYHSARESQIYYITLIRPILYRVKLLINLLTAVTYLRTVGFKR